MHRIVDAFGRDNAGVAESFRDLWRLPWPDRGSRSFGPVSAREASRRGFNVVFWRDGDLGYVLVSDVDAKELGEVAGQLAPATVRAAVR